MSHSGPHTVVLPADVAEQVQALIDRGTYATDDDVLRDAMHALEQREKLRQLRTMVDASLRDPRPSMTEEEVEQHFSRRAATLLARGDHA